MSDLSLDDQKWIINYLDRTINSTITLTEEDQELVKEVAKGRSENAQAKGFYNNWGSKTAFEIDLEGFGAELAFCRMFDCEPDTEIGSKLNAWDCITKKGNKVDVKWTSKEDGELLVKQSKKRKGEVDIWVLMTGKFPTYNFVGYATDEEVFNAPITNYGYGDNYTIRQEDLHTLTKLN